MAGLKPGLANVYKKLPMCDRDELRAIAIALEYQQKHQAQG